MVASAPQQRWQEEGLSISFRSCQLTGLSVLASALRSAGSTAVEPDYVGHLDLAENEISAIDEIAPFKRLLSLDISHNSVDDLPVGALPPTLLHLNASYNRLEAADAVSALTQLLELNLSYNLLTSCQPLEPLSQLQVLLLGGNRISSLLGLASLGRLELLDARFNYVEKPSELRLLAINASLRTLSLQGARHARARAAPALAHLTPRAAAAAAARAERRQSHSKDGHVPAQCRLGATGAADA
jgi:Leucine-rich repeat (LRR) protein